MYRIRAEPEPTGLNLYMYRWLWVKAGILYFVEAVEIDRAVKIYREGFGNARFHRFSGPSFKTMWVEG